MTLPGDALTDAVQQLVATGSRPVVLIDGGAGSGKTTLANDLAQAWPRPAGVEVVSLDELYPGWGGLAAGARAVPDVIAGDGFQTWDWRRNAPGGWRALDRSRPLIVEGCGAITPASSALAGLTVWLELDEAARRQRAVARDGAEFAAHWDEWADQEATHWLADHPRELADLVLGPDAS